MLFLHTSKFNHPSLRAISLATENGKFGGCYQRAESPSVELTSLDGFGSGMEHPRIFLSVHVSTLCPCVHFRLIDGTPRISSYYLMLRPGIVPASGK